MSKIKLLYLFIIASVIFSACNKYEEGPFLSLSSAEKRIAGDYNLDKYYINDEEICLNDIGVSEYRFVYNKDGTGISYITIYGYTSETNFKWEFDDKKENIREQVEGLTGEWSTWGNYKQILKLTKDELWILDTNNLESTEFHFVEK